MPLEISLCGAELLKPTVHDLCAGGRSPAQAIFRSLQAHIYERVRNALGIRLCKTPVIRPEIDRGSESPVTLPELIETGYEVYYLEVQFSTFPGDAVEDVQLWASDLDLIPFEYGEGIERAFQLKVRPMKRQINHVLRINHLRVPGALFREILEQVCAPGKIVQPLLPNFQAGPDIAGFRSVSYDDMLTGSRTFCNCSRAVHRNMLVNAREMFPQYVSGSWPEKVVKLLERATYAEKICHLCLGKDHAPEVLTKHYGLGVELGFENFIDQVMFDLAMDRKTARAEIMQVLGLSRWLREAQLFKVIRILFPDHRVVREASPDWLGRMRFDIFLPDLNLAIEHQGEQHFRPIAIFGGEEAHAQVVARDALKRQLCQQNGVEVIDVRFDASITIAALRQRLRRFLAGDT